MAKQKTTRTTSKHVAVRIPNDLHAELTRAARDLGVPFSQLLIGGARFQVAAINTGFTIPSQGKGK